MPTRTESECTTASEDEEMMLFPLDLDDFGVAISQQEPEPKTKEFVTLRERRQLKLGFRKVSAMNPAQIQLLPLNVLIPHAKVTDKNRKWYEALKKVWYKKDPWEVFHLNDLTARRAIRHRYDPIKQKWHKDEVKIKMEDKSFNRGAMRQCYRLRKLSKFCHSDDWRHAANYVAKKYMESVDRSVYFEDVKLQMDAKLWGEEYNRHNPPKKVDIFQMYIIELVDEPESPLYHLEHFIEGEYIKYNSNSGFVEETRGCRHTPQAFSHFSFERSGHELIIVDIQGVGDLYTDPQIHTMDGLLYGDGNLGVKGMSLFFSTHQCNDICRALNLHPFDLHPNEIQHILQHHTPITTPMTEVKSPVDQVVSPSNQERMNLTRMLSSPRQRAASGSGLGSLPENEESHVARRSASISESEPDTSSNKHQFVMQESMDSGVGIPGGGNGSPESGDGHTSPISIGPRPRLASTSSDDYPYDTSEYCSSIPSSSASFTKLTEKLYGLHTKSKRAASIEAESLLRKSNDADGDSILGQVHHEMAKYHEIGRFVMDADPDNIDWASALFHEEHAADLGVGEAVKTMANIYLHIPHDVLVSCSVEENEENTNKGVELMMKSAMTGCRASLIYMAKAYETGVGLGTARERDHKEALALYEKASQTQDQDDGGEFDATMSDPNYLILAKMAELHRAGEFGLTKDPNRSGELYTEAADEAMAAMKGRLANQYYMLAEEAWGEVEEE